MREILNTFSGTGTSVPVPGKLLGHGTGGNTLKIWVCGNNCVTVYVAMTLELQSCITVINTTKPGNLYILRNGWWVKETVKDAIGTHIGDSIFNSVI